MTRTTAAAMLVGISLLGHASPATARLLARYEGFEIVDGTRHPATAQLFCGTERVALAVKGSRPFRIQYLGDLGILRVVDDAGKRYAEVPPPKAESMLAMVEKQVATLPPAQREAAKEMLLKSMGPVAPPAPAYARSDAKETIRGYSCTRVDVLHGRERRSEYWCAPPDSLKLTEAEAKGTAAMHARLDADLVEGGAGAAARAFRWDATKDGVPVRVRSFDGKTVVLELELTSLDRESSAEELFALPEGYEEQPLRKP